MSRLLVAGPARPGAAKDDVVFGPYRFAGHGNDVQIEVHGSAFAKSVEHPAVIRVMVTPDGEPEAEWGHSSFLGWSRVALVPQPGAAVRTVDNRLYSVRLVLGDHTQTDPNDVFQITILEVEPMVA